MGKYIYKMLFALPVLLIGSMPVNAERIKDIASISGVRTNQLIGYGLVVGLDGTGDQTTQTPFTVQSLKNMLQQLGVVLPADMNLQVKNVAAVTLHAELPAFSKPGQRIDVTASSFGNAKSLRGGTLLASPLKGVDGNVYAIAQGSLVVGGMGIGGNDGSKVTINVPSVGRILGGATVEREAPSTFGSLHEFTLNLNTPDFTTARRVADVINGFIGDGTAAASDATAVRVLAPESLSQRVSYISVIENLTIDPAEAAARVIINSKTGTVVIGSHVTVRPAAVSHGNLIVSITERKDASQPQGALSGGSTVVVPSSDISVIQQKGRMFLFEQGTSLNDIVQAVNNVGAAPGDLVSILEALKEAGALQAELIVI